jgi:DNA polymerase IV (DinB-like DNA polymerase)
VQESHLRKPFSTSDHQNRLLLRNLPRVILHVDLDAFYTSVEQRENPSLRGKSLIVGADPKEGTGRGVVVACSYEARSRGVRSGQPISRAYKLCPDGTYLRPNIALYGEVSYDVMELLRKFGDKFEQVSIDEAFLDASQSCAKFGGPIELGRQIKSELMRSEGLTCSVGIAPNKSAAKIASDFKKPDGLTYVDPEHVKEFLAPLPVSRISGIGRKTEQNLNELGIRTIGELASHSPKALYKLFGKSGVWLWAIANAEEKVEVQETYIMKSIGAEHTFEIDTQDWSAIDKELLALIGSVHKRVLDEKMTFRTVTLKIRFKGFQTYTRAKTLRFASSRNDVIADAVRELSNEFRSSQKKVRLVGVRVSGLEAGPTNAPNTSTLESFT